MKKRSSNQIKKILIGTVILVVGVLIALIIFLLNVDIKGADDLQDNTETFVVTGNTTQNIVSIEDSLSQYNTVIKDDENMFEVRFDGEKMYFSILDKDNFLKKYPNSEVNTSNEIEIATHNYNVDSILIGTCKNDEYLIALMSDGKIGIMNVQEAIENNVFRIKNQLISIGNAKAISISNGYKESNNKRENTIIVKADDGKKYDLADFVE